MRQWDIWCFLVLRPFLEVLADEDDIVGAPIYLCEISLESGLSDIFLACF